MNLIQAIKFLFRKSTLRFVDPDMQKDWESIPFSRKFKARWYLVKKELKYYYFKKN